MPGDVDVTIDADVKELLGEKCQETDHQRGTESWEGGKMR